ncbi:MAG: GTP-binding protein [Lachnospiraceae bacterium]|nr:GTP-binding protein [Lachnospiraceae bacterium]
MTKIDIISGFLGAGKTTFIKKMLEDVFQGEKIVLIENEFGEIGIDGGFLKDSGIEISELNSGCICCSLVGDFGKNLREVMERFHPDRILIEPSGVGKLSDVMKSVQEVETENEVKLNGRITVVNTAKATKQMKAFGEFFNNQIAYATVIVLSRTQNLKPEQTETVVKEIRKKNDKAAIITTPWDEIDGKQIYKVIEQQKSLEEELMEAHHSQHEEHSTCGCHDHHEHSECGHEHEHSHHEHEKHEHSHHEHEKHEHSHHEHGEHEHNHCEHSECGHGHEHSHHEHEEHNHHEHGECGHGHGEHDHHGHDHSEHGENCTCGCHDHHHHHADEVFTSWGRETPHVFAKETIEHAMKVFCETEDYGTILRAKGMVPCEDGTWIYFDMVDGEYELRTGEADYTGRLCVIGTELQEEKLEGLFGIS